MKTDDEKANRKIVIKFYLIYQSLDEHKKN